MLGYQGLWRVFVAIKSIQLGYHGMQLDILDVPIVSIVVISHQERRDLLDSNQPAHHILSHVTIRYRQTAASASSTMKPYDKAGTSTSVELTSTAAKVGTLMRRLKASEYLNLTAGAYF
eukprot:m.283925 g.283925  ORF g.283925 m.283925 type:complete len:119 (+) comp17763_c1_seq9:1317-1673(+)